MDFSEPRKNAMRAVVIVGTAAAAAFALTSPARPDPVAAKPPSLPVRPSIDPSVAEAGRLIATILNDGAVTDKATPRCTNNGRLSGELVRERDASGSPISVLTVVSARKDGSPGVVSNVTVKGDAHISDNVIERVAQFFNDDGISKAKELLGVCWAKSHSAAIDPPHNADVLRLVSGDGDEGKMGTGMPVSLRINLCLWNKEKPQPICREVPLTPGVPAGPGFDSQASCETGKAKALGAWLEEAKQVFGFTTGLAGAGYQISEPRCVTNKLTLDRPNQHLVF